MYIRPSPRRSYPVDGPICKSLPTDGSSILSIIGRCLANPNPVVTKKQYKTFEYHKKPQPIKQPLVLTALEPVVVSLTVVSGKVKVKLNSYSYDLHQKYFNKGKKPPMMEYIKSLSRLGYSEDVLNKVYESYMMWEDPTFLQKIDADIDRIWPGAKTKKLQAENRKILKAVKKL
jgi:hypothetical protein